MALQTIKVVTAFPEFVSSLTSYSIIKRAIQKRIVTIETVDLRKWGKGSYQQIDDEPYGGGAGMVLMVEPIYKALQSIKTLNSYVVLTSARGKPLDYKLSSNLAQKPDLIIVCGHYEGVDQRVHDHLVDETISVGDFILSGGEIAAMCIIDSIVRLLPGAIKADSLLEETNETFHEYPQYTRPEEFKGWKVPNTLLSGNHAEVKAWRDRAKKQRK